MSVARRNTASEVDSAALLAIHNASPAEYREFVAACPPVFFAAALRCWVVMEPTISLALLRDRRLAAYSTAAPLAAFAERFDRPMPAMILAARHIPAMLEGAAHAQARSRLARALAETRAALAAAIPSAIADHVRPLRTADEVDLVADILAPLASTVFGAIPGLRTTTAHERFDGGRIFDRFSSIDALLRAERAMSETLSRISSDLGEDWSEEEAGTRLALNVLGRDTIVGTFAAGLVQLIPGTRPIRLDSIDFPETPPDTGVPFVERSAGEDFDLDGVSIRTGDRFRLYLRGIAFDTDHDKRLIFGAGHHACLGRPLSLDLWAALGRELATVPRSAQIAGLEFGDDNFFRIPKRVRVVLTS